MHFNPTIDLGSIIGFIGLTLAFYAAHKQNIKRLVNIEFKVSMMWRKFEKDMKLNGVGEE